MITIPTPWTSSGQAALTRRGLLRSGGSATALATAPSWLWGRSSPDLVLILMADLHSGYAYTASLLEAVKAIIGNSPNSQVAIVVNGDIFEAGNFLSGLADPGYPGAIDFAFLARLGNLAPTLVTIGNHDGDLFDPNDFAAKLAVIDGVTLVSDLGDTRRDNALYAPQAVTTFGAPRGNTVKVTSIGTPSNSYKDNSLYYRPDPAMYAADTFPGFYTEADFHLALVHAGFVQDTRVLPSLTTPFLLHGGHDHLSFSHAFDWRQGLHIHSGYWSSGLATVGIEFTRWGVRMHPRQLQLTRGSAPDAALAGLIADAATAYLDDTNNSVIGTSSREYDLDSAVLVAVEVVRDAAGADIGFLSHTTFGQGLPNGEVRRLDLNSFVRFPGGFSVADIDGATLLSQVLPICNQFGRFPYKRRTGDYLYTTAMPADIDPGQTYRCVVNSFAATGAFFGSPAPSFAILDPMSGSLELRALVSAALAGSVF